MSNHNTPYADFLQQQKDEKVKELLMPSYMVAADTIDVANKNTTFAEDVTNLFNGFIEGVSEIPSFVAVSLISGANQLYNVPMEIANAFGADYQVSKTEDVMAAIDSDYSKFYKEHKEGTDLVGFIVSSIVPGSQGVRVLKASQMAYKAAAANGKFGTTFGKALGLLAPDKEKWMKRAVEEVKNSNALPSLINRNALRGAASGFGQSMYEAAAFETAVAATMFNSPVLENQDFEDLAYNILWGGAVFGIIGGGIGVTKTYYKQVAAAKEASKENMPWTHVDAYSSDTAAADAIALDIDQIRNIPEVPSTLPKEKIDLLTGNMKRKTETIEGRIRSNIGELTKKKGVADNELADTVYNITSSFDTKARQGTFIGAKEVVRVMDDSKIENSIDKLNMKAVKGTLDVNDGDKLLNYSVGYVQLHGPRMGATVKDMPVITNVADTLKAGEKLEINVKEGTVKAGKRSWDFGVLPVTEDAFKSNKFDMLTSDPLTVNARYAYVSKLPPLTQPKKLYVDSTDIPLLEKVVRETEEDYIKNVVIKNDYGDYTLPNRAALTEHLTKTKERVAFKLLNASEDGKIYSSQEAVLAKLRSTGIDFTLDDLGPNTNAVRRRLIKSSGQAYSAIVLNKNALTNRPLSQVVGTLLHEEGHTKFDTFLEIGGIPASKRNTLMKELVAVSKKRRAGSWKDLESLKNISPEKYKKHYEYLNSDHELMADAFAYFTMKPEDMAGLAPTFNKLFGQAVRPLPKDLIESFGVNAKKLTQEEIAAMVNVTPDRLSGKIMKSGEDLYAHQLYSKQYSDKLRAAGKLSDDKPDVNTLLLPQHAKIGYDASGLKELTDNNVISNLTTMRQRQKLYIQGVERPVAAYLGEDYNKLIDITSKMITDLANRIGASPSALGAAAGNYGSLASVTQSIGKSVTQIIEKAHVKAKEVLEPHLQKLANNQEAAIEFATLNNTLRSIPDNYVFDASRRTLVRAEHYDWLKKVEEINIANEAKVAAAAKKGKEAKRLKKLPEKPLSRETESIPDEIRITNDETFNVIASHVELNGKRIEGLRGVRAAQGVTDYKRSDIFYPIPVDPKDYPHFLIVSDESITGTGHIKMLYARNEKELAAMRTELEKNPQLRIRTKSEAEQHYKDYGQWEIEKTLNDNYLDVEAKRKGTGASYIVPTDPKKISEDLLNWHMKRETGTVREMVLAKYEIPFAELKMLGDNYTNLATSKFSNLSLLRYADEVVKNPYGSYIKTALGIKNHADYPWWVATNRLVDDAISKMYANVAGAVESARSPQELEQVNEMLKRYGYKGATYSEEMDLFSNARANKGILSAAVRKANGILATITLRLDFLNAINNTVSANVLLGAETRSIIKAIENGDANTAGELAKLMKIRVPGTDKSVLSPTKLIANSIKRFHSGDKKALDFYRENRYITSISDQYKWTLDAMTFNGKESIASYNSRIDKVHNMLVDAANTGEKWTGNRLAEEFNRFVAADVMKQITDIAVKGKLITAKEQLAYINTFVNRTQGNYLAAQRPMAFQGPIGQAIGLFQTYQFNLMQQLLRYVGEGTSKDAMTLLGLQATIHGMNGLPAFNAINSAIIGNAAGNEEHKDIYSATYNITGKQAGDWLLYGMASNMFLLPDLKVNLYTRGDINPRHVTVLPTSLNEIPIIGATSKFFGNLFETVKKINAGADISTAILQGIEHNGISRPLAGLAQTLEAAANPLGQSYSTSNKGNVIASNDFLSLVNFGRLLGGKPMDEAIAIDAMYRINAYNLRDINKRKLLGEAVKTTLIAGQEPTQEQVEAFAEAYASLGGKQEQFNQWVMDMYKSANASQANALQDGLKSRFSQSMQEIMGGYMLKDFSE